MQNFLICVIWLQSVWWRLWFGSGWKANKVNWLVQWLCVCVCCVGSCPVASVMPRWRCAGVCNIQPAICHLCLGFKVGGYVVHDDPCLRSRPSSRHLFTSLESPVWRVCLRRNQPNWCLPFAVAMEVLPSLWDPACVAQCRLRSEGTWEAP